MIVQRNVFLHFVTYTRMNYTTFFLLLLFIFIL
jgi:hypothetical protein